MAISARLAALREQRRPEMKRRVLTPGSLRSTAQTLAKQTVNAEFQAMAKKYDEGMVGNEEMRSFLQKSLGSKFISLAEKTEIESSLRTFDKKIALENLQAVFDSSSGAEKITAAAAVADFYRNMAAEMAPNTPAQANALQKQAEWSNKGMQLQEQTQREERRQLRADKEYDLSLLPNNTVEGLTQKAQMYGELSRQAAEDGEGLEATQYATKGNNIIQNDIPAAQDRATKLQEAEFKGKLQDAYRIVTDDYYDGRIDATEAATLVKEIDDTAISHGLYEFSSRINQFATTLQNDIQKGVARGDIEGLPYKTRMGQSEVTKAVKEWKQQFAKEDDMFTQGKIQIAQLPDAASRTAAMTLLYASYLYGAAPSGDDAEGWVGLKQRQQFYSSWAQQDPDKAETYQAAARDIDTKIMRSQADLSVLAQQYEQVVGDDGSALLQTVTQNLPSNLQLQPGAGNNWGRLVAYDALGRPYEKLVRLDSQYMGTDPNTGEQQLIPTKIGSDIAQTPDGTYVQLKNYFPEGVNRNSYDAQAYATKYAEYKGQFWVQDPFDGSLKPAAEVAQTDDNINQFYQANLAKEQALKEQYAVANPEATASATLNPPTPALPQGPDSIQLPEGIGLNTKENNLGKAGLSLAAAEPSLLPQTDLVLPAAEMPKPTPQVPEVPKIDYITPSAAQRPVGVGIPDYYSPKNDVQLTGNIPLNLPQNNLSPIEISPTSVGVKPPADNLYNAGTPTQNNLQQSGLKLDLGDQYAPEIEPKKQPNLLQRIGSTVSNWWKGLF